MRKSLLLTCLLTLACAFGMAQTTSWPITITTADGLPGVKGPMNQTYKSPLYKFSEAIQTLRMTVVSTNSVDELTNGYWGLSVDWGSGQPFFTLGEVNIYDANGNKIVYTATSNAASLDEGPVENLNDGKFGTHFHSVYKNGQTPQAYHYIEFAFAQPVNEFSIEWLTRKNPNTGNRPTYVGLTPGTDYQPYPEQEFKLGEKVTSVEELAAGGLFVIRDNAPEFLLDDFTAADENPVTHDGVPTPNKAFYTSPVGGTTVADANAAIYLVPTGEEDTYKVAWLNNGHFIGKNTSSRTPWTLEEINAAPIKFTPSDDFEGDFILTTNDDETIYISDAIGWMVCYYNSEDSLVNRNRPYTTNFSIYKASINNAKVKDILTAAIEAAEERIEAYGKNEVEDKGEYDAITTAVAEGKAIIDDAGASAAAIINATTKINSELPAYVALGIFQYTDSIGAILDAIEDGEIAISGAGGWIEGSFPEGCEVSLQTTIDEALQVLDTYTCVADIDAAIDDVLAAIDAFWASEITGVMTLPFRVSKEIEAYSTLPGSDVNGSDVWESPLFLMEEPIESFRLTVFNTVNGAKWGNVVFASWGEFEIFDEAGNKVELTEGNFTTNSVNPNDGSGIPALCDGDNSTYFHNAWGSGQDPNGFDGNSYTYLEVTLPEPMSAFKYKQTGRKSNKVNSAIDFVFGEAGVDVTPETVLLPDPNNAKIGEQVTDASQITDDGIYAIQGLYNCDPVNFFEDTEGPSEPVYYSGAARYGKTLQAPCAFTIRKTGDADGTFYIQSMADSKFWSKEIVENGWGSATSTYYKSEAAKLHIKPNNNEGLPGSFVIYQYVEGLVRDDVEMPYVIYQDWDGIGTYSVDALENNEKNGEGEWYIFKMTMDNPNIYWATNLVATAEALGLEQSEDPGYYKDLGNFPTALASAQAAVEAGDETAARSAAIALSAALEDVQGAANVNPVVEGVYVFEHAYAEFEKKQGVKKAMFVYYNDGSNDEITADYMLYWGDAPEGDYKEAAKLYHFELISARESDIIKQMVEVDSTLTPELGAQAFYIRNIEFGGYVNYVDGNYKSIGIEDTPASPYVIRHRGGGIFDIWNPAGGGYSLHANSHGSGSGKGGDLVYWGGDTEPSQWRLRTISTKTSVDDIIVAEGDEVVSVTYYTVSGVQVAAPVKGVNIVKTVYANGVVKTAKVFVK